MLFPFRVAVLIEEPLSQTPSTFPTLRVAVRSVGRSRFRRRKRVGREYLEADWPRTGNAKWGDRGREGRQHEEWSADRDIKLRNNE